ncbi:hypothetical protein KO507_10015 [Gilvimarinus agarilyticus]|uniref:hypothetical protein n=1 Tax=Gilvimarinus sp. 2_MG-2023 TaxID=3062666 RepID=UPI001C0902E6|nr:hypothetical protein [Gilvimarinus sp. 2_MG-2023]MBU2886095.1 hypothetical protein [Gilvimarinus agarilyticus]MDO6570805.1 hypothetical protein [Gilvimarinus sp. 2_MG-2023]
MKIEALKARAAELINLGASARDSSGKQKNNAFVSAEDFYKFRASSLSFLGNLFGSDHSYYLEFNRAVSDPMVRATECGIGIMQAVHAELAGGWLTSARSLIAAEVFSDFIEMADHLLAEGYKDATAVILGGVLEEHLRTLASAKRIEVSTEKNGTLIPKKADRINSDLATAGVYSKLDQKNVTAWLGLRNCAAHAKYDEYSVDQVRIMRASLVDFMARNSAH